VLLAWRWIRPIPLILLLIIPAVSVLGAENESNTLPAQSHLSLQFSMFSAASQIATDGPYYFYSSLGEPLAGVVGGSSHWNLHSGFWTIYNHYILQVVNALPPPLKNLLIQNFPNPFNPSTTIRYSLAGKKPVSLAVFSLKGELVCKLVSEVQGAGDHEVQWNGRDENGNEVASGVYLSRLQIGEFTSVKKMMLLK